MMKEADELLNRMRTSDFPSSLRNSRSSTGHLGRDFARDFGRRNGFDNSRSSGLDSFRRSGFDSPLRSEFDNARRDFTSTLRSHFDNPRSSFDTSTRNSFDRRRSDFDNPQRSTFDSRSRRHDFDDLLKDEFDMFKNDLTSSRRMRSSAGDVRNTASKIKEDIMRDIDRSFQRDRPTASRPDTDRERDFGINRDFGRDRNIGRDFGRDRNFDRDFGRESERGQGSSRLRDFMAESTSSRINNLLRGAESPLRSEFTRDTTGSRQRGFNSEFSPPFSNSPEVEQPVHVNIARETETPVTVKIVREEPKPPENNDVEVTVNIKLPNAEPSQETTSEAINLSTQTSSARNSETEGQLEQHQFATDQQPNNAEMMPPQQNQRTESITGLQKQEDFEPVAGSPKSSETDIASPQRVAGNVATLYHESTHVGEKQEAKIMNVASQQSTESTPQDDGAFTQENRETVEVSHQEPKITNTAPMQNNADQQLTSQPESKVINMNQLQETKREDRDHQITKLNNLASYQEHEGVDKTQISETKILNFAPEGDDGATAQDTKIMNMASGEADTSPQMEAKIINMVPLCEYKESDVANGKPTTIINMPPLQEVVDVEDDVLTKENTTENVTYARDPVEYEGRNEMATIQQDVATSDLVTVACNNDSSRNEAPVQQEGITGSENIRNTPRLEVEGVEVPSVILLHNEGEDALKVQHTGTDASTVRCEEDVEKADGSCVHAPQETKEVASTATQQSVGEDMTQRQTASEEGNDAVIVQHEKSVEYKTSPKPTESMVPLGEGAEAFTSPKIEDGNTILLVGGSTNITTPKQSDDMGPQNMAPLQVEGAVNIETPKEDKNMASQENTENLSTKDGDTEGAAEDEGGAEGPDQVSVFRGMLLHRLRKYQKPTLHSAAAYGDVATLAKLLGVGGRPVEGGGEAKKKEDGAEKEEERTTEETAVKENIKRPLKDETQGENGEAMQDMEERKEEHRLKEGELEDQEVMKEGNETNTEDGLQGVNTTKEENESKEKEEPKPEGSTKDETREKNIAEKEPKAEEEIKTQDEEMGVDGIQKEEKTEHAGTKKMNTEEEEKTKDAGTEKMNTEEPNKEEQGEEGTQKGETKEDEEKSGLEKINEEVDVDLRDERMQTPLHLAAARGHLPAVMLLLEHGSKVDSEDVEQRTPLHFAVESGEAEVVAALLQAGAPTELREKSRGRTPIHLATLANSLDILKLLLEPLIDNPWEARRTLKMADKDGRTLLHLSTHSGLQGATELLLSAGAEVNMQDHQGYTPMHAAIMTRQKGEDAVCQTLLTLLLDAGGQVCTGEGDEAGPPLHTAARVGCHYCLSLLTARGAATEAKDSRGRTSLHAAVEGQQPESIQYLVSEGAKIESRDRKGHRPLHHAIMGDCPNMVARVLEAGATKDAKDSAGLTYFQFALHKRKFKALEALVVHGVTEVGEDQGVMHYCAAIGSQAAIEILLNHEHDIDDTDKEGCTALHHAICSGHEPLVLFLINSGSSVSRPDRTGATPLHYAVRWGGSDAVLRRLVKKEGNVAAVDRLGRTPLHYAASKSSILSDMYILLNNGAKLNTTDDRGLTPLHLAARLGNESLVRILLDNDAKHDIRDCDNFLPIDHARENNHKCIMKRLENYAVKKERENDPRFGLYSQADEDLKIQSQYRLSISR